MGYSSVCPSTGLECSVRAYIIDEIHAAEEIINDQQLDDEMRQIGTVTIRAGEKLLVTRGCSESDCSAGLNATKIALNPQNFARFVRLGDLASGS